MGPFHPFLQSSYILSQHRKANRHSGRRERRTIEANTAYHRDQNRAPAKPLRGQEVYMMHQSWPWSNGRTRLDAPPYRTDPSEGMRDVPRAMKKAYKRRKLWEPDHLISGKRLSATSRQSSPGGAGGEISSTYKVTAPYSLHVPLRQGVTWD